MLAPGMASIIVPPCPFVLTTTHTPTRKKTMSGLPILLGPKFWYMHTASFSAGKDPHVLLLPRILQGSCSCIQCTPRPLRRPSARDINTYIHALRSLGFIAVVTVIR